MDKMRARPTSGRCVDRGHWRIMPDRRITLIASGVVFWTGVFWGFYWLPVRSLEEAGLAGAWGTVAITLATLVLLIPVAIRRAPALRRANPVAMVSLAIGGAAFTFYSVGFVHGRVAIIVLLYCLTPVWSALIGRFVMGWPITPKRSLAIVLGLLGLAIMLGSTGEAPIPRGPGE